MNNDFYSKNSVSFFEDTVNVDLTDLYLPFISCLPNKAKVLDAGCGSGRDALAFLRMGYQVDAFDASAEMVKLASDLTGINVHQKRFEDIKVVNHYDGIWCCASLLHVPLSDLPKVMTKLARALKTGGSWYISFKYGNSERKKDGRHFTDLNEKLLKQLLTYIGNVKIITVWITEDLRPHRFDKWLNAILKKEVK